MYYRFRFTHFLLLKFSSALNLRSNVLRRSLRVLIFGTAVPSAVDNRDPITPQDSLFLKGLVSMTSLAKSKSASAEK